MIASAPPAFAIGWDVGGWNCDKNKKSRDAIVILDATGKTIIGEPWRGNVRRTIASASTTGEWLATLFSECKATIPAGPVRTTIAIDTPLGFPSAFTRLVTHGEWSEPDARSSMNHYLFRETERHLYQRGRRPLSTIKDQIGSQATKGMHALAKFAPIVEGCGVWTDGKGFRAIETYPAVCRDATPVQALMKDQRPLHDQDKRDALVCAIIAHLFATDPSTLESPLAHVPVREGWIWVPRPTSPNCEGGA